MAWHVARRLMSLWRCVSSATVVKSGIDQVGRAARGAWAASMKKQTDVRVKVPDEKNGSFGRARVGSPVTPVIAKVFGNKGADESDDALSAETNAKPRSFAELKNRSLRRLSGRLSGDFGSPREGMRKSGNLILRKLGDSMARKSSSGFSKDLKGLEESEAIPLPEGPSSPAESPRPIEPGMAFMFALERLEKGAGTCDALLVAMYNLRSRMKDEKVYPRAFRILKAPNNLRAIIRLVCNTNDYKNDDDIDDIRMRYVHHYVVRLLFQQDPDEFRHKVVLDDACMDLIFQCFRNPASPTQCIHTCTVILLSIIGPFQAKLFDHFNNQHPVEIYSSLLQHIYLGPVQIFCSTLFSTNVKGLIQLSAIKILNLMQQQFASSSFLASDPSSDPATRARAVALVENTSWLFLEFSRKIIFTGRVPVRPDTKPGDYSIRLNDSLDSLDAISNPQSALDMLNVAIEHALQPPDKALAAPLIVAAGVRMVNNLYGAFFQALNVEDKKVKAIAEARSVEELESAFLDKIPILTQIFTRFLSEGHGTPTERIGTVGDALERMLSLYASLFREGSITVGHALIDNQVMQRSLLIFRRWPNTTILHRRVAELMEAACGSKVLPEIAVSRVPAVLLQLQMEIEDRDCLCFVEASIAPFGEQDLDGFSEKFKKQAVKISSAVKARKKEALYPDDIPARPKNVQGGEAAALFEETKLTE